MTTSRAISLFAFVVMFITLIAWPMAKRYVEAHPRPKHYNEDIVLIADALDLANERLERMGESLRQAEEALELASQKLDLLEDALRVRQGKMQWINAEVTAYTPYYESTQKTPSHPAFNITASGLRGGFGVCAADPIWPFGTVFYVPGLGACVVLDRGGAIRNHRTGGRHAIDFMVAPEWLDRTTAVRIAREWGRRRLAVRVLYVP